MIITEIKKIGKGRKYYLYVDEQKQGVFADIVLAESGLKTGQEVSEQELAMLKEENGKILAFDTAIAYLSKIAKSERGIKRYLKEKGFDNASISHAVKKLNEYGYINDKAFAENFLAYNKGKYGKAVIKLKLKAEGVDSDIIDEVVESLSVDDEYEKCEKLYFKYIRNKEKNKNNKQKTIAYLYSKGYDIDLCKKIVNLHWEEE